MQRFTRWVHQWLPSRSSLSTKPQSVPRRKSQPVVARPNATVAAPVRPQSEPRSLPTGSSSSAQKEPEDEVLRRISHLDEEWERAWQAAYRPDDSLAKIQQDVLAERGSIPRLHGPDDRRFGRLCARDPHWKVHTLTWLYTTGSTLGLNYADCERLVGHLQRLLRAVDDRQLPLLDMLCLCHVSEEVTARDLSAMTVACLIVACRRSSGSSSLDPCDALEVASPGFRRQYEHYARWLSDELETEDQVDEHGELTRRRETTTSIDWVLRLLHFCSDDHQLRPYHRALLSDVCHQLWSLPMHDGPAEEPWLCALLVLGLHPDRTSLMPSSLEQLWLALQPQLLPVQRLRHFFRQLQDRAHDAALADDDDLSSFVPREDDEDRVDEMPSGGDVRSTIEVV